MRERISKSAKKRRFKDEESAAAQLATLSDNDLKKLDVGRRVKEEIVRCRGQKGGALKRQVKYLAKVMREDNVEEVYDFLAARKGSKLKETKLHREVERLRDALINEAIEVQQSCLQAGLAWEPDWPGEEFSAFLLQFQVDEGDLRRTIFQYVKTRTQNHYREVFRIVKAAVEKEQLFRKAD